MEIICSFILGLLGSYLISSHFHRKQENTLIKQNMWLDEQLTSLNKELPALNRSDKLVQYANRMEIALGEFITKGTPVNAINSFSGLTLEEKAKMYDQLCLRKKGRLGKNPYR